MALKIACPCCGETLTDDQIAELRDEIAEYGPGGTGEPAGEGPDAEPMGPDPMKAKSMGEAIDRELDSPAKQKARAARKE